MMHSDPKLVRSARDRVRAIVEGTDSRVGRIFDFSIQFLIVISLITFSVETLPGLSGETKRLLQIVEVSLVAVFTVEYLLRLWVAKSRMAFVTSFYGLVDLASILPFYLARHLDLRAVRALRLMRLFRILKLARYSKAMSRFRSALTLAKEEIVLFLFVTIILLYLAAVGIYFFENEAQPEQFKSVFHSLWWAVATLTTVGYGDVYPITIGGRLFTFAVLVVGLGIVAVPAGLVSSALSKARELEEDQEARTCNGEEELHEEA